MNHPDHHQSGSGQPPAPRTIRLEGAFNMRDIGGLPTADSLTVRRGRIFRADSLSALTDADMATLAPLGLRTVIDLRTRHEAERQGGSRIISEQRARHLHLPILEGNINDQGIAVRPPTLAHLYADMVANDGSVFATIFRTLADDAQLPAVIHCTAGKDRTGVTIALLQLLLNVPDDVIVADYAATDGNMPAMIAFTRTLGREVGRGAPPHFVRAEAATMTTFLQVFAETHGSAADYLTAQGVSVENLAALRERLLQP